jgi:triacylglycerol lipase
MEATVKQLSVVEARAAGMGVGCPAEFALDAATLDFSIANALACARWSKLAYEQTTIASLVTGAACLIQELDNAFVIAFRGSRSVQDFICDAEFPRITTIYGGVHSGFERDIESIMPRIWSADAFLQNKKPVFITGHSLGGALAILCARNFVARNVPVQAVYTFGQPRVGDSHFADGYDAWLFSRTFRVVNQCDIVPRVPGLLCGFRNVGQKYFLPCAGEFLPANPVLKNPKLWLLLLSDAFGLWNDWANKKQLALLDDHFIASYIAELEKKS